ncbi:unnamed protein product [Strongylus vulgaris]|uniref:Peptidase M28 domain-containing protein n=1 Tax=Strongylus vulgaris TaxID=40348 RepID=A0A3P7KYM6_STRVU|nr:unnamed protein product [Strongylus vulgaris]
MSDEASSNGQNSLRTSRSSLIKRKKIDDHRNQWLPVAFAASLFGILATVSLLLVMALLAIRQKPCEEQTSPDIVLLRENVEQLDRISKQLSSLFEPARIKQNLRWLAETSHIAGTIENAALIRRLADKYVQLGFKVKTYNYSVLLNYADFENPNTIKVEKEDGTWWRLSRGCGHPSGPPQAVNEQLDGRSEVWWNAYSANGSVVGRIVYCNFGTAEDFRTLDETYPHSPSLPGFGAQRGSVGRVPGDPLTPLLPSLPYVTRSESMESLRKKGLLPSIPVTPIGYDDAQKIMDYMDGPIVTRVDWIGGIFVKRTITNIIAILEGTMEPDRWVMLGNHVDAWGKGAIDPISGTAVQLEVARVAAKVFGTNPPRRSLVFCHWDAEEFGLIGSSEFIEERLGVLQTRAIAYINRFITFAGIPAADVKLEPMPGQSYALYHTMFETPWTVENLIDPNFSSLTSVGQLWIEIDIANGNNGVAFQRLESINFRLQYIERSFLDQNTQNPYYRHLVFSPSSHSPRFTSFACILDPALDYHLSHNETDLHNLAMAITKVQYAVETAIDILH